MNRILLMVLRNIVKVPAAYWKLCHYAKHTDKYPEIEKYAHIQYILKRAIGSGNINLVISGQENIPQNYPPTVPAEPGFLLVGNHQGMFDIIAVAGSCDIPLGAVLKKELAHVPFLKQIKECTHSFAMDRDDLRQSMEVIKNVTAELKKGRNFLIFPEGTRSKKGNEMIEFHWGSFKCAVKAKSTIVPFALIDSYQVLDHKGSDWVTVQIHYLDPIPYEEYKDMKTSEISEMVQKRIAAAIAEHQSE